MRGELSPVALAAAMLRMARESGRRARPGALGPPATARCSWAAHGREVPSLYDSHAPVTFIP